MLKNLLEFILLQWIISELAAYNYSNVVVSLYDTLGADARIFIVNQTGIKFIICDDEQKLKCKYKL